MRVAVPIVIGIALLSSALFFWQGGFGGGHGRFDLFIFILGFPWTWIAGRLPNSYSPTLFSQHDAAWLIVLPFVLNLLVIASIAAGLKAIRQKNQTS